MAKSKSDISNSAIRIFLHKVGGFYDEVRGFEKFKPSIVQKKQLLKEFSSLCCYCGTTLSIKSLSQDHLIPINKASLGLHAWGNVVPCCKGCNNAKQQKSWLEYLGVVVSGKIYKERKNRLESFVKKYKYNPNLHLGGVVDNLYQDVGEVALTLIELRYRQAENIIKNILAKGS